MVNTATVIPEEQHFILSSLPPGPAQKRLALAVVVGLFVVFSISGGPLSTIQLGRIDAFVPAYAAAMFVTDSSTAVLLCAQVSGRRSRAGRGIASGYRFAGGVGSPGG